MYTVWLFCSLFIIASSKIHMVPTLFFQTNKKTIGHIFGDPITLPKPYWIRYWVGHNSLSKLKQTYSDSCSTKTAFLRSIPEIFKISVKESYENVLWKNRKETLKKRGRKLWNEERNSKMRKGTLTPQSHRSSLPEVLFKKAVLKIFRILKG